MYIGELAKRAHCTPKAIRLYEQMGLITPQRDGSYRRYTAHHLKLVQMIRQAQAVGFKLGEMSALLAAKQHHAPFPLAMANQGIEAKRAQLHAEIQALQNRQTHLTQLQQQLNEQFGPEPGVSAPASA